MTRSVALVSALLVGALAVACGGGSGAGDAWRLPDTAADGTDVGVPIVDAAADAPYADVGLETDAPPLPADAEDDVRPDLPAGPDAAVSDADTAGDEAAHDSPDAAAAPDAPALADAPDAVPGDPGPDDPGVDVPAWTCPHDPDGPLTVHTHHGSVTGMIEGASRVFGGIPYAAPPIGAHRWRPPEPPGCLPPGFQATAFGPICPQLDAKGVPVGSEDCLTLNVWAPLSPAATDRPVLVFLHGGGNFQGSSSTAANGVARYDGHALAEGGDAVVVTLNYRLGALGFLALPELSGESPDSVSGNYGIRDQIRALRWVHDNIAFFGGDPSRVLLFGQSAGGADACVLLASPLAKGLFSRVLIESGGSCVQESLAQVEADGDLLVQSTPCAGTTGSERLACMRGLTAAEVITAIPGSMSYSSPTLGGVYQYTPNVDGVVLPASPLAALAAGTHNHVPFAIGSNHDETMKGAPDIATEADYTEAIWNLFAGVGLAAEVLALYPLADFDTPLDAWVAVTTDLRFSCPVRRIARAAVQGQTEPVYRYWFSRWLHTADGAATGALHGLELLFVFRSFGSTSYVTNSTDLALSDKMIGYWTRFAATGDPGGEVQWPAYVPGTDPYLHLHGVPSVGSKLRRIKCDFWDDVAGTIAGGT